MINIRITEPLAPFKTVGMKKRKRSNNEQFLFSFWATLLLIPTACSSFVFGVAQRTSRVDTSRDGIIPFRPAVLFSPNTVLHAPSTRSCCSGLIALRSWSLTSALESLVDEDDEGTSGSVLTWLDPSAAASTARDDATETESVSSVPPQRTNNSSASPTTCSNNLSTMPLYPLPAVYLPTNYHSSLSSSCQLRNTERPNVQMALDVGMGGEFCVVLRAMDTGRIATHGTVMRLLDMDVTRTTTTTIHDENDDSIATIQRILITCRPERIVKIVRIENPQAALLEYRLRHPHEYLLATVQTSPNHGHTLDVDDELSTICHDIQQIYQAVRQFYLDGIFRSDSSIWRPLEAFGPWAQGLPEKLPLPCLGDNYYYDEMVDLPAEPQLWKTMEIWQSWCETVRELHQRRLVADRNELLVEMAVQQQNGKPLRLPIRMEDSALWSPNDRRRLQNLENRAQQSWWDLRLDPCLDFQTMLMLPSWMERLQHLQRMVARELCRLEEEQVASRSNSSCDSSSSAVATSANDATVPRKGAWFDEDCW